MNKSIGIVGCGNLGFPLAYYLISLGITELSVHDIDEIKADSLVSKVIQWQANFNISKGLINKKFDILVLALSGPETINFLQNPVNHSYFKKTRIVVSLGRPNYDDCQAKDEFNSYLERHNITLLMGFGLEPGLVEVLLHDLAREIGGNNIEAISAYCGGVSKKPRSPLNYDLLFGDKLPSLNRIALAKRLNVINQCLRFDYKEDVFIDGVGLLEAYHDGLSPYLLNSPCMKLISNVTQKTARWPGFFDSVNLLRSLGLLDEDKIEGYPISISEFTHQALMKKGLLRRNSPDISFIYINVQLKSGKNRELYLYSTSQQNDNLTGMAKLTCFMAAYTAVMILTDKLICRKGMVLSHDFYDKHKTETLKNGYIQHGIATITDSNDD